MLLAKKSASSATQTKPMSSPWQQRNTRPAAVSLVPKPHCVVIMLLDPLAVSLFNGWPTGSPLAVEDFGDGEAYERSGEVLSARGRRCNHHGGGGRCLVAAVFLS